MTLEKTGTPATTFIYALSDPRDGKLRYIGKADDPSKRFQDHLRQKNSDDHRGRWIRSLLGQGLQPGLQVLYETPKDGWPEIEKRFIHTARNLGFSLVNSTDGGDGITMTPEIRAKISAAHVGKKVSPETRAKMSASRVGSKNPLFGKGHPVEARAKMSAAHKGKKLSKETRARMSAARLGGKRSDAARENMRRAQQRLAARRREEKLQNANAQL